MSRKRNKENLLYAIYKDNRHLGDVREISPLKAIDNYILESGFPQEFLDDDNFTKLYKATVAEPDIHYSSSSHVKLLYPK